MSRIAPEPDEIERGIEPDLTGKLRPVGNTTTMRDNLGSLDSTREIGRLDNIRVKGGKKKEGKKKETPQFDKTGELRKKAELIDMRDFVLADKLPKGRVFVDVKDGFYDLNGSDFVPITVGKDAFIKEWNSWARGQRNESQKEREKEREREKKKQNSFGYKLGKAILGTSLKPKKGKTTQAIANGVGALVKVMTPKRK